MAAKKPVDSVKVAWGEYLADTRSAIGWRYAEVEPWAWARLQTTLRLLKATARAARSPLAT